MPICNALQKEARAALSNFEECTIQYVVANIRTDQGATLSGILGVPHVTLVLYDAAGEFARTSR